MITIYTDGSSLNNQHKGSRRGGVGVFYGDNDIRNISKPLIESNENKVTNQVAELTACLLAIENNEDTEILICTDSMYTINCVTRWAQTWKGKNWRKSDGKKIENLEIIQKLYEYYLTNKIKFKHVRGHKTEPPKDSPEYIDWYGNMMADLLATNASKTI